MTSPSECDGHSCIECGPWGCAFSGLNPGDTITLPGKLAVNPQNPFPLQVTEETLAQMNGARYGDIVTITASDGSPAQDWRTGIPFPTDQRWVLAKPK